MQRGWRAPNQFIKHHSFRLGYRSFFARVGLSRAPTGHVLEIVSPHFDFFRRSTKHGSILIGGKPQELGEKQWSKSLQVTSVGDALDGSHENTKLVLRAWCLQRFTHNNFHLRQDCRRRWLATETARLRADIAAHGGLRNDQAERVNDADTNPMLHGHLFPPKT